MSMEQSSPFLTDTFDEIVFHGRNKRYGSFVLRSGIRKNTFIGLYLMTALTLLYTGIHLIDFSIDRSLPPSNFSNVEVTLSEPPPLFEVLPPAVPPAAAPQNLEKVDEMEVKPDNEVSDIKPLTTDDKQIDSTSTGTATSGSTNNSAVTGDGNTIYSNVEVYPQYPGGPKGLKKYLSDNVQYPEIAHKNNITGTVWVVFVVNQDGSVSDVKVEKGIGGGCDQEAIRVVQGMRRWKPGMDGGKPVRVYQRIKIGFALDDNS